MKFGLAQMADGFSRGVWGDNIDWNSQILDITNVASIVGTLVVLWFGGFFIYTKFWKEPQESGTFSITKMDIFKGLLILIALLMLLTPLSGTAMESLIEWATAGN